MEEKSNIQTLKEFARASGREVKYEESYYPRGPMRSLQKFRRMVYMPESTGRTSFFVWYNDPMKHLGPSSIFCGTFIPLSIKTNSKIHIRKRYLLDKLNVFSKVKRNKTGNDIFDSKVRIYGDLDSECRKLLSRSKTQNQILNALNIKGYIFVSINEFKIDFIPELKDKALLSIVSFQNWIVDRKLIDKLFYQIERIRETVR